MNTENVIEKIEKYIKDNSFETLFYSTTDEVECKEPITVCDVEGIKGLLSELRKENHRNLRVYIAGPISGHDDYVEKFEKAELYLRAIDFEVINPAELALHLPKSTSNPEYYNFGLMLLNMADAICLLDGWEESAGAVMEYKYAVATGKMIIKQE